MRKIKVVLSINQYFSSGGWESCSTSQKVGCGSGTRERNVWCYEQSSGEAVSPDFCKSKEKPAVQKACFIACQHHKGTLIFFHSPDILLAFASHSFVILCRRSGVESWRVGTVFGS